MKRELTALHVGLIFNSVLHPNATLIPSITACCMALLMSVLNASRPLNFKMGCASKIIMAALIRISPASVISADLELFYKILNVKGYLIALSLAY
jgi:hypothetical protein